MIPVDNWSKIMSSFDAGGMPMPFVKEIFLIECSVAGTGYVEDIEAKTQDVDTGSLLAFRREPHNKHDQLAIQILNAKNQRIGYVPRAKNEILARLMDGGKLLFGRVEDKMTFGDWLKISIKVYLRDL